MPELQTAQQDQPNPPHQAPQRKSGWRRRTLADVVDFRNGMNFTEASRGQAIKVIGVGDFKSREALSDFSDLKSVVLNGEVGSDDLLVDNDLLFVRSNGNKALIGRCMLVTGVTEPLTFSGFTIRARIASADVDHSYLSKLVQSPLFKAHLHRLGGGSSINNLSQDTLSDFAFDLPSLTEQRKIAEILRTWDEAIEKLQALRDIKRRRLSVLTRALVFGSLRLGNYRQTTETASHRWFTLPADWSCKAIGKIAVEISERQSDAEPAEVLSCSKHDGFVRSLEYFKKQVFSADLTNYKRIWRNDFGFPSNHVEEGSIGLQDLVDVGIVSPIYTVFRFAADVVDPHYAYAVLKTALYRHIFEVSTSASVDRRGSLRWGEFAQLPFPLPSLPEQRAIVEVLNTANADIAGLSAEIETLTRQKRGLMQKLLTGEWRVAVEGVAA